MTSEARSELATKPQSKLLFVMDENLAGDDYYKIICSRAFRPENKLF